MSNPKFKKPAKAIGPKWNGKCPFCESPEFNTQKNGNFNCTECRAVFHSAEHEDVKLRKTFAGYNLPYDVRKFKQ